MDLGEEPCSISQRDISTIAYKSSFLTLVSSCLSIFGSSLIILTFILWKDVRQSVARIILLFLAIADLGTGLGYLISSTGNMIFHEKNHTSSFVDDTLENSYSYFCSITSFLNTYFPVASFFWTGFLAIYFVIALVLKKNHWSRFLLIIFNIIAWGVPFVICTVAVTIGILGESGSRTSAGWCFVAINGTKSKLSIHNYSYEKYLLFEAICGKGWELFFTAIVLLCYTVIFCVNRKWCHWSLMKKTTSRFIKPPPLQSEHSNESGTDYVRISLRATNQVLSQAISRIDLKLLLIPIVFIVLRFFGTYRYFLSMRNVCKPDPNNSCAMTKDCFNYGGNFKIVYLQALFDPLQGFGNAVLFVFLSKTIMRRLYHLCIFQIPFLCRKHCICKCLRKQTTTEHDNSSESDDDTVKSERSSSFSVRYSPIDNSSKEETLKSESTLNTESTHFGGGSVNGSLQFNYGSITESREV